MTPDAIARLSDAALRARVDPSGFDRLLQGLPAQARSAWQLGLDAPFEGFTTPSRVLLVGLGGSAIGADVAATLASDLCEIPVRVVRNYHLPPLTPETLVILSSFSGDTEETLAAFDTVAASDAQAIAVTTGGRLAARARRHGMPLIIYAWDGAPRTGLGFGVFIPLALLRRLGVMVISDAEVQAAFETLDRCTAEYGPASEHSRARHLAAWLEGSVPAIIGADMLEVAARRWAGEISENAKQPAASYAIPEFNHNQFEAVARPETRVEPLRFVLLDAPPVHPRNRLRVTQTAEMMQQAGRHVEIADAGGETPLEAILASCALGSWTSYYLSLLREVDPASMTVMDQLKRTLAQEQ
ncbi:MAG: SIS domain-containing protein [Chloroflexi bacterium]|nr:SIS domain-containing protein [Chloroflexota bacterium]MDA1239374.1 SIS domain-containing protein [Chloroflexota bacterium]MQC47542.1 SIS domain-containing protein [Chloroflexota bacterium]